MKPLYLKAAFYVVNAAATPWYQFLSGTATIDARAIATCAIGSLIAGATAGFAFFSTANAEDKINQSGAPMPNALTK